MGCDQKDDQLISTHLITSISYSLNYLNIVLASAGQALRRRLGVLPEVGVVQVVRDFVFLAHVQALTQHLLQQIIRQGLVWKGNIVEVRDLRDFFEYYIICRTTFD